ncbi:S49 family peptidase [Bacillus sp. FSL R5-0586]|uniref:SDH family Clp fold serine proteinase n=1 Tax=Bacillus sp. FSL R5-0586 TaxID=2954559 RepID=UPI000307B40E
MPNWNSVLDQIQTKGSASDSIRRQYLKDLSDYTGRNTIIYYSNFLQKTNIDQDFAIHQSVNDNDKNGFMAMISNMEEKGLGLDLILHTPGGNVAATESLVDYLKEIFGTNIRAIVPQIAMSAGTMISCSCSEIIMGKHSNIGPIDPQIYGRPAHAVLQEFNQAAKEISEDQSKASVWMPIIAQYTPTLIGQCQNAIEWSEEMVTQWLQENMFSENNNPKADALEVVRYLGSNTETKSHSRHISAKKAQSLGLKISYLENDSKLQDLVLSLHHATIHTLSATNTIKIIENQNGISYIQQY